MEEPTVEKEQNIFLEIKDKAENGDRNEYDNLEFDLQVNVKEPEPNDPLLKWAERNIDENLNRKVELVEELRDMLFERGECEPHRTDDPFLLRFLRARHFIVKMAHRLICNYYSFRETNPEYFFNIDFNKLLDIGESEIFSVPPYVDEDGRRMLYVRFEKWNPSQFTITELFQAIIFLIQAATLEPKHQILGGVAIIDVGNISANQAWYLTPSIAKHILEVSYSSLPHRIEAIHIVNVSRVFDYAFSMLKPFLSEIMKKRIFIHQDLSSLHSHISAKYLPKRYGGVHKDYQYNDWLAAFKNNEELVDEIESLGYERAREFIKTF